MSNRLIHETSPYLLQHAHNPVDWFAWGQAAFDEAQRRGAPIFLSVGYSTCYWCHVMERECFEQDAIARLMNEHFVCIKVDREERPDVDDIYMTAVQLMTGRGGWPMSVFLTPPGARGPNDSGLEPFYAGTYFPPRPGHGLPSFPQMLGAVAAAWIHQLQQVLKQARQVTDAIRASRGGAGVEGDAADNTDDWPRDAVRQAARQLMQSYDREHGGFGDAPKFPQPANLQFLLATLRREPDEQIATAMRHTLERMARGGMYDQIAGGFHRYSTDARWLVPHFEKMLYDQGQLIETYAQAQAIAPPSDDPTLYQRIVRQTCDYILREMTDADEGASGCFFSAQDAEVDAREGGSYLWSADQVREAMRGDADAGLLVKMSLRLYGLDQGTNFGDPHHPDAPPANVLFIPQPMPALASALNLSLEELIAAKARIDVRLLAVRNQRKQPGTDDKVLVAWNGLMIGGLARAGRMLGEHRYLDAAARAAAFIHEHMRTADGGLYRTRRSGRAKAPAFLEDYAFFVHGLIGLHRATSEPRWLDAARHWTTAARDRFASGQGGYFDTLANQADLIVRGSSIHDGAIPGGNSQMIHNLLDLHELTGSRDDLDAVRTDLAHYRSVLLRHGAMLSHMQHALVRSLAKGLWQVRPKDVPVRLRVEPQGLDLRQGTGRVALHLDIADGYHLAAHGQSDDRFAGVQVSVNHAGIWDMQVDYPRGVARRYAWADELVEVYEGTLSLGVRLSRQPGAGEDAMPPQLLVRVQACTQRECLAPLVLEAPLASGEPRV